MENKWLNMGVTPPEIQMQILSAGKNKSRLETSIDRSKKDILINIRNLFPEGFTYEDLMAASGRTVHFWRQFVRSLRLTYPDLALFNTTYIGHVVRFHIDRDALKAIIAAHTERSVKRRSARV